MVRNITTDTNILQSVSKMANPKAKETKQLIQDLMDTAQEHKHRCVGLAAIQIEEPVRVFVAFNGERFLPYVNPVIIQQFGEKYETEEGCMSLKGTRKVVRYDGVEIMHQKGSKFVKEKHTGYYAEILQHEMDHLNGILI